MKGLFQGTSIKPEGDLWDHTMLVLDLLPPDPSFPLAFAALFTKPASPPPAYHTTAATRFTTTRKQPPK